MLFQLCTFKINYRYYFLWKHISSLFFFLFLSFKNLRNFLSWFSLFFFLGNSEQVCCFRGNKLFLEIFLREIRCFLWVLKRNKHIFFFKCCVRISKVVQLIGFFNRHVILRHNGSVSFYFVFSFRWIFFCFDISIR